MSKWDFQIHTYIPIKAALFLSPFVVLFAYACGRRGENRTHTHTHTDTAPAAAAKLLQSCPTLCNPVDGSPPAPPSLGFSRQEHWSGLPFPSPMHESEK